MWASPKYCNIFSVVHMPYGYDGFILYTHGKKRLFGLLACQVSFLYLVLELHLGGVAHSVSLWQRGSAGFFPTTKPL